MRTSGSAGGPQRITHFSLPCSGKNVESPFAGKGVFAEDTFAGFLSFFNTNKLSRIFEKRPADDSRRGG